MLRALNSLPSIKNIHEGNWKHVRLLGAGKVGDMSVEGDALAVN